MLIIDLLIIFALVAVGYGLDDYFNLTDLYITPPVAGVVIGVGLNLLKYLLTGRMWLPQSFAPKLLVTFFLFSIGVKIAITYEKKHLMRLFNLFWITVLIMLMIDLIAIRVADSSLSLFALGSSSLAWNGVWLDFIKDLFPNLTAVKFYFHASLWAVFIAAPVVLRLFTFFEREDTHQPQPPKISEWNYGVVLGSLGLALGAIFLRSTFLTRVPFLFSFIIAMWLGIWVGFIIQKKEIDAVPLVTSIGEAGLLSLYGFIVATLLKSAQVVVNNWNLNLVYLLLIKIFLITIFHIILARFLVRDHEDLVLMGACWAFTLSAPISCMNTMNSIVRYHGEADDALLLVPPIVLWLINYAHYGAFLWLYT